MSDNNNITDNNKNSTSMKSEEQAPQEFVLLSDDVKASLIRQEQKNDPSSSPLLQKQNIPEKPEESNESAEIKSKEVQIKESLTEPLKTNALYFIGITSLALNIQSASNIYTSTIVKILVILLINLLTYLALYQRKPIWTFLTKMTKKTSSGYKKTKELASKKKRRLFIIGGVLAVVALVITFQHMKVLIDRLEKQNCEQYNMLRNLQLELNDLKIKTQRTNQLLHELTSQTIANTEESARRINNLTKQVKQLESVISNQQQQIQSISTTKRDDFKQSQESQGRNSSQRSGIKEDRAGNIYMVKTEKTQQQPTKQEQEKQPQQQCKSQEQTQQQQPQQKAKAMNDDRLDFITNSFMVLNDIIPLI